MSMLLLGLAMTLLLMTTVGCSDAGGRPNSSGDSGPSPPTTDTDDAIAGGGKSVEGAEGDGDGDGGNGTTLRSVAQKSARFGAAFVGNPSSVDIEELPPLRIERAYQHPVSLTVTVTNTGEAPVTDLVIELSFDASSVSVPAESPTGPEPLGPDVPEQPPVLAPDEPEATAVPVPPPASEAGDPGAGADAIVPAAAVTLVEVPPRVDATVGDVVASVSPSSGECAASEMDSKVGRSRCEIGDLLPGAAVAVVASFAAQDASGFLPITVSVDGRA